MCFFLLTHSILFFTVQNSIWRFTNGYVRISIRIIACDWWDFRRLWWWSGCKLLWTIKRIKIIDLSAIGWVSYLFSKLEILYFLEGDSGGPLTIDIHGARTQVGVVSFGSAKGCEKGFPGVFARVTHFLKWIQQNSDVEISA